MVSTLSKSSVQGRKATDSITGIAINPANPFQLLTSSLDGTLCVWDFLDAVLLRVIDVGLPISHLATHSQSRDRVFIATRKPKATQASKKPDPFSAGTRTNSVIYAVSLSTVGGSRPQTPSRPRELLRIGKTREASGLGLSSDGKWLVAIGNRKVQVARIAALKEGFTKLVSDEALVSLAFHPSEPIFATGDRVGKIRVWRCLDEGFLRQSREPDFEKRAPTSVMHWHAHAVTSLAFTPNGAYLVSGGEEAVLVLWQLSTGAREYVPRLGSPINSIAVADGLQGREQEYALGMADGSLLFIATTNLKTTRTFARVKIDSSRHLLPAARLATIPTPLAVEPITGQIVILSGHPSSLQFYDSINERLVSELEVAPSNRVSRPDELPLEPHRIESVAFSSRPSRGGSGPAEWMATVDSRASSGSLSGEVSLKFWRWNAAEGRYSLNTRVDKPHEAGGGISSMSFSAVQSGNDEDGAGILFATTGRDDRKVKTWQLMSHAVRQGRVDTYWTPRSIFGYRNLPASQARWSPDGSLLLVSFGSFLTLWEPSSNTLAAALSCPELRRGSRMEFVGKSGRYVAMSSGKTVAVWDLVRGAIQWHKAYKGAVSNIIASGSDSTFAVLRQAAGIDSKRRRTTIVDTCSVGSAEPIQTTSVPFAVRDACALPSTSATPAFVAVSESFDVLTVNSESEVGPSDAGKSAQSLRGVAVKRRTVFDDLFGSSGMPFDEGAQAAESSAAVRRPQPTQDIFALFDAPPHLLPPITMLFDALVPNFLPPRRAEDDSQAVDREGISGQEMESNERGQVEPNGDSTMESEQPAPRRQTREEAAEEMEYFTEMFKKQLSTQNDAKPRANGQVPSKTKEGGAAAVKPDIVGGKKGRKSGEASATNHAAAPAAAPPSAKASKKRKSLS